MTWGSPTGWSEICPPPGGTWRKPKLLVNRRRGVFTFLLGRCASWVTFIACRVISTRPSRSTERPCDLAPNGETTGPCQRQALPYLGLSQVLYEWDDIDGAIRHASIGTELAGRGGIIRTAVIGYQVLAWQNQACGRIKAAAGGARTSRGDPTGVC